MPTHISVYAAHGFPPLQVLERLQSQAYQPFEELVGFGEDMKLLSWVQLLLSKDSALQTWLTGLATSAATPEAFVRDPSLVWEFYHWRREVPMCTNIRSEMISGS